MVHVVRKSKNLSFSKNGHGDHPAPRHKLKYREKASNRVFTVQDTIFPFMIIYICKVSCGEKNSKNFQN